MGDFFVVPPKSQEIVQAFRTDMGEIPEQRPEIIRQPEQGEDSIQPQGKTAGPEEKPEAVENGNPETSGEAKAETPPYSSGLLEEEEVSELLDMVLCADNLVPDARVWHSEICSFFKRGNSQEKKANALKLIYGELDEDYIIQDSGYQVHVFGQSEGIVFQADGGDYFYSYLELSRRIDALILSGIYPFSIEEEELDDFAIPDEKEELEESRRNRGTETLAEYVVEGEALSAGEEMVLLPFYVAL